MSVICSFLMGSVVNALASDQYYKGLIPDIDR